MIPLKVSLIGEIGNSKRSLNSGNLGLLTCVIVFIEGFHPASVHMTVTDNMNIQHPRLDFGADLKTNWSTLFEAETSSRSSYLMAALGFAKKAWRGLENDQNK